jgi:cation transport ATPase
MITYDGILIIGEAVFNEAILTGEGTPVLKTSDMQIFSGCTCL